MTNGEENECHGGEGVWLWVFFFFCLVLFWGGWYSIEGVIGSLCLMVWLNCDE